MNTEKLNHWLSLAANVGVIAGILFLVLELRQTNELMDAEARFNRLSVATENTDKILENPELSELILKDRGNQELTALEQYRLNLFAGRMLQTREWAFRELPRSELPSARWRSATEGFPTLRKVYESNRGSYNPEFEGWFDDNIINKIPTE